MASALAGDASNERKLEPAHTPPHHSAQRICQVWDLSARAGRIRVGLGQVLSSQLGTRFAEVLRTQHLPFISKTM